VISGFDDAESTNTFVEPEMARSALLWISPEKVLLLPLMSTCLSLEPKQLTSANLPYAALEKIKYSPAE